MRVRQIASAPPEASLLSTLRWGARPAAVVGLGHFGVVASGDEDIVDAPRAAELREGTNALCVAWEGAGGARAAAFNDLCFAEIRGITDAADLEASKSFRANCSIAMPNVMEFVVAWVRTQTEGQFSNRLAGRQI
jgi:nucleoside phosphorylase